MPKLPILKPNPLDQNIDLIRNSMNGEIGQVAEILESKVDINVSDANGITPLIAASAAGHLEIVELLVSKGANVELKDNYGYDAYHVAMFYGDLKGEALEPFKSIMSVVKYI